MFWHLRIVRIANIFLMCTVSWYWNNGCQLKGVGCSILKLNDFVFSWWTNSTLGTFDFKLTCVTNYMVYSSPLPTLLLICFPLKRYTSGTVLSISLFILQEINTNRAGILLRCCCVAWHRSKKNKNDLYK